MMFLVACRSVRRVSVSPSVGPSVSPLVGPSTSAASVHVLGFLEDFIADAVVTPILHTIVVGAVEGVGVLEGVTCV